MAFRYEVHTPPPAGEDRVHEYASESALGPGDMILIKGRYWLLESVDAAGGAVPARAVGKPARYRLLLRHPDGREEAGAFRRFRPGSPRLGHAFTTVEEGQPASWQVAEELLARDEEGEPYLELMAERDFGEFDALPDHELEHALARREEEELPEGAAATLARAEQAGRGGEAGALRGGGGG